MIEDRLLKEKKFHDERFGQEEDLRNKLDKYYSVHKPVVERFENIIASICKGKKFLEYGCGTGSNSEVWLKFGAILTGIDISEEGIKKATDWAKQNNKTAEFYVMNAEKTDFKDNTFDIVAGSGILHHLNLDDSYGEIARILNSTGNAIFIEPLGHNPIINLYRALTPRMRTEDEHPLKVYDLKLLSKYFKDVRIEYFSVFTLLAVPFRSKSFFNVLLKFLKGFDNLIFSIPYFRRFAWTVIINAKNPIKNKEI